MATLDVMEFRRQLALDLHLPCPADEHEQDWGFVHADGARVAEFAAYFNQRISDVPPRFRELFTYELCDLIVESLRERIRRGDLVSPDLQAAVRTFWCIVEPHHAGQMVKQALRSPEDDITESAVNRRALQVLNPAMS